MVEILRSGLTAMGPDGVRLPMGEDVKYQRVPLDEMKILSSEDDLEPGRHQSDKIWASRLLSYHLENFWRKLNLYTTVSSCLALLLVSYWIIFVTGHLPESCDTWQSGFHCDPKISQFWGQYSPYFAVPSQISRELPDTCKITFAQILFRHGARDPTSGKTTIYNATVQKIQSSTTSYSAQYSFMKNYKYRLGADQLTIFGQRQMLNSGYHSYHRYKHLAVNQPPFVRSSGQERVVESAQNWTQGFHSGHLNDDSDDSFPYEIVVISEDAGQNNSLDHGLCDAFELSTVGSEAQRKWRDVFTPPITKRLNENLRGAALDRNDVIHVMDLCPFETVASDTGKLSPFCYLFSEEEWQQYDYYQSLGKYYGYGWGNPLGASQGVGFTNELVARLTSSPVNDHTSANHTLDDSKETFPIGNKNVLYADFSHDNDLTGIFAAMGLFNETKTLLNETMEDIKETKGYSASWTVPFAARAYVEKLTCFGASEEYVRVVLNDRVLPLETCGGDRYGRCTLNAFVESLSFAKAGGDWDKCFS